MIYISMLAVALFSGSMFAELATASPRAWLLVLDVAGLVYQAWYLRGTRIP